MNNIQKQITSILSNSIRGREIESVDYNFKDLSGIISEAKAHKVEGFIYYYLNRNFSKLDEEDKKIVNNMKKEIFIESVIQSKHIRVISQVLEEFKKSNIPVIVLKGLVVRYLYPQPDLRTMSDADILIHLKDLKEVRKLLISLGYREWNDEHEHGAHVVFIKNNTVIEVHWKLVNENYYNGNTSFEDKLWDNTMKVKVGDIETLSLGMEDLVLHLCIHMAVHLACNGFGIRQLCDLVLVVEKLGNEINWNIFLQKAEEANIKKFSVVIFHICNYMFNMDIPIEFKSDLNIQEKYINLFIDDIFNNGVNGKKDESELFAKEFAFQYKDDERRNISASRKFIKLMFPPIKEMSEKYNYAKKNKILCIFAWIHHLFEGVKIKDYSLSQKAKILTKTISICKKREKLIKWLEI